MEYIEPPGLDVAFEALRDYRKRREFNPEILLHFARIDRVGRMLKPYLEVLK